MHRFKILVLVFGLFLSGLMRSEFRALASDWPAFAPAVDVGDELLVLDASFEPSGVVYHPGRDSFIGVSDEGQIAELSLDGQVLHTWSLGPAYDLEDVTVLDQMGATVFLADENTSQALEFSLADGKLTGVSADFSSHITELAGNGLEGLTWVPDGYHEYGPTPDGGVFLAGWQEDGDIYVFKSDFKLGKTDFLEELHLTAGYTDLSALAFESGSGHVFAAYDALNLLEERTVSGELITSYTLPNTDQEGLAIKRLTETTVEVWLAEDSGTMWAYTDFILSGDLVVAEPVESVPVVRELASDGFDNDLDGLIDEPNTVAQNGLHPDYAALDPLITKGLIKTAKATVTGGVIVTYIDNLVYEYPVFSTGLAKLKVSPSNSYISAKYAGEILILNALNGDVYTRAELGL